ncbi:MAG: class I SAM-dependent methyltransferase [Candidatus Edwardsbacteria bacterium]|nr:class I SAM-dependent methyltransferase [Candidatus Edwardsbacteria bacterium]
MINLLRDRAHARDCRPFSQIPPYYDRLMKDVDYEQWARYLVDLVRRAGLPASGDLLDLGCGTGTFAVLLARAGFTVTGIDSSPEMLRIARDKAARARAKVRLSEGDLRSFAARNQYPVAVSLFAGRWRRAGCSCSTSTASTRWPSTGTAGWRCARTAA